MIIDDEAFVESCVGITNDDRLVYDEQKMVEEFMQKHECSEEDAYDYIEFNVIGSLSYIGNGAPIVFSQLYL